MTNKEKFLKLVSDEPSQTAQKLKERIEKRNQLRESRDIAYKVIDRLKELKWSQKRLAEEMGVSPQYVNKMMRGKENLTLSTQVKLQELLDIPILASYYERRPELIKVNVEIVIEAKQHVGSKIHGAYKDVTSGANKEIAPIVLNRSKGFLYQSETYA